MDPRSPPPTLDKLRHDIDSGRTGDKIDYPDPAAAPLGADAEAGGQPTSPDDIAEQQVPPPAHQKRRWLGLVLFIVVGLVLVFALGGLVGARG
ncbi:hypothetical protein [Pelagibacterium montanilacus]|uniref:hypothetical protein n=1 Tax=Pelagibacterium montanilacus TaxID=2185280 RepID=UPI000F8DB4BB|nr:hypothetical protein [Pelagibacterium montanilacus]